MNENFNNQNNQQGLNFNPVQGNNASMVNPLQGGNMQPNSQMNTSMQQPMENQTMAGGLNQQGVGQIHQQQVMPQQSIEQSGNMMNQQGVNGIHQQPIQPVNSMPGMPNPAPSPLPNNPQFAPNPNLMPNNNQGLQPTMMGQNTNSTNGMANNTKKEKKSSMNPVILVLLILSIIAAVGYYGYNYYIKNMAGNTTDAPHVSTDSGESESSDNKVDNSASTESEPSVLSLSGYEFTIPSGYKYTKVEDKEGIISNDKKYSVSFYVANNKYETIKKSKANIETEIKKTYEAGSLSEVTFNDRNFLVADGVNKGTKIKVFYTALNDNNIIVGYIGLNNVELDDSVYSSIDEMIKNAKSTSSYAIVPSETVDPKVLNLFDGFVDCFNS